MKKHIYSALTLLTLAVAVPVQAEETAVQERDRVQDMIRTQEQRETQEQAGKNGAQQREQVQQRNQAHKQVTSQKHPGGDNGGNRQGSAGQRMQQRVSH